MHYMPEEGCPWYGRIQHTRTITTTVIPTAISLLCHMIVQWMKERSSTMTTDARTCWYQKHDLLACAARHGFSVTESRFDEWVERGLIFGSAPLPPFRSGSSSTCLSGDGCIGAHWEG